MTTFEVEVNASGKERRQGFAVMDPEARREAQARGGRRAQANGTGYRFTKGSVAARKAGAKGGRRRARNARASKQAV